MAATWYHLHIPVAEREDESSSELRKQRTKKSKNLSERERRLTKSKKPKNLCELRRQAKQIEAATRKEMTRIGLIVLIKLASFKHATV